MPAPLGQLIRVKVARSDATVHSWTLTKVAKHRLYIILGTGLFLFESIYIMFFFF